MNINSIKVLVVDDHPLVRQGVLDTLSLDERIVIVGEAKNGSEAYEMAGALSPDLIIMDLQLPATSGLEATAAISADFPDVNILVFTVSEKHADLFAALKSGARGYVLKDATPQELSRAVLQVGEGGVVISAKMAAKLFENLPPQVPTDDPTLSALTPRELEVLRLVAQGASNKEIASSLYVSKNTVKTHMRNILDKLHLSSRTQAASYATRLDSFIGASVRRVHLRFAESRARISQ